MSLLRDLQEMATKSDVRVTSLLLKARILAARLDHEAFDQWITSELDGYPDDAPVPAYREGVERVVKGDFMNMAWSFPDRLIPKHAVPDGAHWLYVPFAARMPISEVEEFAASKGETIPVVVPPEIAGFVRLYDNLNCVRIWADLPRAKFRAILDAVRAKVIQYAVAIERANPKAGEASPGDNPVPREQLNQIQQIFLGGSHVVTTAGRDVTQGIVSMKVGDVEGLLRHLRELGVPADDADDLRVALNDDADHAAKERSLGPRVLGWLGKMTEKAATGAWQVGSQVGVQVLAKLLMSYYGLD